MQMMMPLLASMVVGCTQLRGRMQTPSIVLQAIARRSAVQLRWHLHWRASSNRRHSSPQRTFESASLLVAAPLCNSCCILAIHPRLLSLLLKRLLKGETQLVGWPRLLVLLRTATLQLLPCLPRPSEGQLLGLKAT